MKSYLTFILLTFGYTLYGQNSATILGRVLDTEKKALEKATVSILNKQDSSVISYTLADDNGKFKLFKIPTNRDVILIISHVGTAHYSKTMKLQSDKDHDLGDILLETALLDEVVISIPPPVRLNGDSLEYNASYFKTRPNATVEELLKKLPGLQVNFDGTIYYEGKEVSKVLINNKEFFAQDMRIATRNLDADMVSIVQVFRDKGDSKKEVEDESTLPVTINLKFKKELARADFGKFYGSGGSRDRYESGVLLNTFRDTLQVSFIGFGNNINRQSFDYSELAQHAGLSRGENYGFQNFGGRNYGGVQNDISGGVNVNYDWGKITKLNVMYQYNYGNALQNSMGNGESYYDETTQRNYYQYSSTRKSHQNSLSGKFTHKFDTTLFLRYSPTLTINKSSSSGSNVSSVDNINQLINSIDNSTNSNDQRTDYRHDFYIEKAIRKKLILSLNNSLFYSFNKRKNLNNQLSTIYAESANPNARLFQNDNDVSDGNGRVTGSVQWKISKTFNLNFFGEYYGLTYQRDEELALAVNQGLLSDRDDSENDLDFTTSEFGLGTSLSWTIKKHLSLQAGLQTKNKTNTFDYYNILDTRKEASLYWLPSFNIRYKTFSLNYSKTVSHPSMYSIRSVDNTMNEISISRAFPYAKDQLSDVLRLNMNKHFNNYKTQVSVYGNLTKESYSLGYKNTQDLSTGRYVSEMYVAPGTHRLSGGMNFSQRIKMGEAWNLRISQNLNSYTNQNYQIQNDMENKNTSWGGNLKNEFTFSWKDLVAIAPNYTYGFNKNFVSTENPNFRNNSSSTQSFSMGANINNIRNFSLESSYQITAIKGGIQSNPTIHLVNISLYYDMKTRGQVKLSAFDLLNQNISIYNGSYHNSTYHNESLTLKQYFLLGYIYKFNKAKMK